ncbi:MAG: hypothetical protein RMN25_10180 [Anaerolineae bacterium]|nr:hypothetical protein [Thermoflexales bacterium]MDW8408136.1 hypothetical protein [Anaerolineae bacterium]
MMCRSSRLLRRVAAWALIVALAALTACGETTPPEPTPTAGASGWRLPFIIHPTTTPSPVPAGPSATPPTSPEAPSPSPSPEPSPTPVPTPVPRKPNWGINVADWSNTRLLYELGFEWIQTFLPPDYPVPPFKILYRISLGRSVTGEPAEIEQFARVVEGVAYKHRGVIQAYSIGNEVNLLREWGGQQPNPELYTRLLQIAYEKIKAVDPEAIVVSAGLAPTGGDGDGYIDDLRYARQMLNAGAGQFFDVYGFHPYGFAYPPEQDPNAPGVNGLAFRRAEAHRAVLEQYGLGHKPMWATEFGWLLDPRYEGRECSWPSLDWQKVTPEQHGQYARRAFDYARANWPWMGVMFLWNYDFSLSPLYADGCEQMKWFSIVDLSGRPRPIVEVLRP